MVEHVSGATSDDSADQFAEANRNRTMERVHFVKRSISLSGDYYDYSSTGKEKTLSRSESCSPDLRVDRPMCRTDSYVTSSADNDNNDNNNDDDDNDDDDDEDDDDDDVARNKEDYDDLLNELTGSTEENWVRINMIDFTHVFPAEDQNTLDLNYLEGIENLIKLVEMFLITKDVTA